MINAELLSKTGISYAAGMRRFMNDAELYEAVLTAFAGEDILERAAAAYSAGDNEKLLMVVHEAKGSGGNAGLDRVYAEASALVALLRCGSFTEDELTEDYERFADAYTVARDGIRAALGL